MTETHKNWHKSRKMCPRCCINCKISLNASKTGSGLFVSAPKAAHPEVFSLSLNTVTWCEQRLHQPTNGFTGQIGQLLSLWADRQQEENQNSGSVSENTVENHLGVDFIPGTLVGPEKQIFWQRWEVIRSHLGTSCWSSG